MSDERAGLVETFWMAVTLDEDEGEAAARFAERYGQPPELIVESYGILLLGPLPRRAGGEA